jgi:LmbE family N-acetylglucosaminyl deacetylase
VVVKPQRNRIDAAGTGESAWQEWSGLRGLPTAKVDSWRSAVVIAAHPDDEILGVGGTIARMATAGAAIRLVAVTDGEASHPGAADTETLARRRRAETAAALRHLGAREVEVIRLALPDSQVAAFEDRLTESLTDLCAAFDVCFAPWDEDAHPDHEAAGRAARRARPDVLSYPIWMWHWARPADPRVPWDRACRVPLPKAVAERKGSAITAFTSQLTERPGQRGPVLPPAIVAHFTRRHEVLFR